VQLAKVCPSAVRSFIVKGRGALRFHGKPYGVGAGFSSKIEEVSYIVGRVEMLATPRRAASAGQNQPTERGVVTSARRFACCVRGLDTIFECNTYVDCQPSLNRPVIAPNVLLVDLVESLPLLLLFFSGFGGRADPCARGAKGDTHFEIGPTNTYAYANPTQP